MKADIRTDLTIGDILKGFQYSEIDAKGLFGWSMKLTIQPEYQRNYIYADKKMEIPVIESVFAGYPLGILYFNKVSEDKYEVLDGQQRITSLGRFYTDKFSIIEEHGLPHKFSGLSEKKKSDFLNTPLVICICDCEGDKDELKEWFEIVNKGGVILNEQERLNAVYSGPFVTLAKAVFSNKKNSNTQQWGAFVKGPIERQKFLETALRWVSNDHIAAYMHDHQNDTNIDELHSYFCSVIEWITVTFEMTEDNMCGLDWGRLFRQYHTTQYDLSCLNDRVRTLLSDPAIKKPANIYEYVLSGETLPQILEIRLFEDSTKSAVYQKQTLEAKKKGISNCPICACGTSNNRTRIYKLSEMDADHVTAWSKGGATTPENCQMLCKTHNRSKGNK